MCSLQVGALGDVNGGVNDVRPRAGDYDEVDDTGPAEDAFCGLEV